MPFLSLHGTKLRYRDSGPDRPGPPLLLIHGAGASSAIWLPLVHRLGHRRRVVALDLPGHGRSGGRAASVEELRDAVGLAAATLGLGPSILVGHSLGGLVALSAAATWPDKVAGLALVTTGARIAVAPAVFAALETRWETWPALLAEVAFSPVTPPDDRRAAAALAVAASREQTIADYQAVAACDLRHALPLVRCPTLVVAGEDDLMTPPKLGARLVDGIAGARLVVLPRCGHMPMAERPDALAENLAAFVAGELAGTG